MRVVVLAEAAEDIEQARGFYDAQEPGAGDYCADSLLADIESLTLYHGIHSRCFGFYRMLASRFPFEIYYRETKKETQVLPCWICAATQIGFAASFHGAIKGCGVGAGCARPRHPCPQSGWPPCLNRYLRRRGKIAVPRRCGARLRGRYRARVFGARPFRR